jgi:hypothetical protein
VRSVVFPFGQPGSIGNRSRENGGRYRKRTHRRASICWIPSALCGAKLFNTTMSPGAGFGPIMYLT